MKNAVFLLLFVAFFGCQAQSQPMQFKGESFSVIIPSGFQEGIAMPEKPYLMVNVYPKSAGKTIDSLVSELEGEFEGAITSSGNNSIAIEGKLKTCAAEVFVRVGHINMTNRDVEIETLRILKADKSIRPQDMMVETLAKAHVTEMAQVLFSAYLKNIKVEDKEIDKELEESYKTASQNGLPKEAFLNNWGITEKEFRNVIANKIAYEKLMDEVTSSGKTDSEKNVLATKYLQQISTQFEVESTGKKSTKACSVIKPFGENISVMTYALFGEADDSDIEKMASLIVFDKSTLPSGKLYIFSPIE